MGDNEQGIKTVSSDMNAIAYVSIGAALINKKHGVPLSLVKLDGVTPSAANIKNGKYSVVRELNLVTKPQVDGDSQKFINYIYSDVAKKIIEENHFVPVRQVR